MKARLRAFELGVLRTARAPVPFGTPRRGATQPLERTAGTGTVVLVPKDLVLCLGQNAHF